ncbi:MAG: ArsR family transcriptional regulator, partial [Anaerolineales bacterium]
MAESFKALGDPTRLQILTLILKEERCVSELADHMNVT